MSGEEPSSSAGRVLCVGAATLDFIFGLDRFPEGPLKFRAKRFHTVGGGNAATAAVSIARLGGEVHLLGRVGEDAVGRQVLDELEASGVRTELMVHFPGNTTPLSAILVDAAGERQVISYTDPDLPTGAPDVVLPPGLQAVLADLKWPAGTLAAFVEARKAGIPTVLDGDVPQVPNEILALTTIAAYSRQALTENTGTADVETGLRRLAERTPAVPVVTDGAAGLWWLEEGRLRHMPAFPVEAVDTLGAGDVFHGALALAVARGMALEAALRFASAVAAIKVTRFGGRAGSPSAAEVERLLQQG